jgi:competence ComEA-like helix-hairpin-helix protein
VNAAWLRPSPECKGLFTEFIRECRVVFKGDLVPDTEGRGVDANNLPFWLPDRPTGDGVEGGTMESYFTLGLQGLVDLNAAGEAELDGLPGVGPELARAILATRESLGGFRAVDDLLKVPGIGRGMLARLRPHIRV